MNIEKEEGDEYVTKSWRIRRTLEMMTGCL
jgi:hypothetical protein